MRTGARSGVRLALLQLQRLQNGLVVLVFVLQHHVVDESFAKQRVVVVPFQLVELVEDFRANLAKPREHLLERRQRKRGALRSRVLERVVHPRHLRELDRPTQVPGEPELFKVRDVPDIPDDRAHERIVLPMQIHVRQFRDEEQCPLARLGQEVADGLFRRACLDGGCRHHGGEGRLKESVVQ